MEDNKQTPTSEESDSLEDIEDQSPKSVSHIDNAPKPTTKKVGGIAKLKGFAGKFNIYLLAFIILLISAAIVLFIVYSSSTKEQQATVVTQELNQDTINDLVGSDAKVGDPKQLLTIESDSVFTGKVLIRDGLDVAGPLNVGGALSLPGITVSGASAFDQVTANELSIAGDATVQGQLNVQSGLTVSGPLTISGAFSADAFVVQSLQVEQNITINRHIDAGGGTPDLTQGAAIGSGGTATISGTDTAGTVTVNIGSGASSGILATINFVNTYGGTPHVVITPVAAQGSPTISGGHTFYLSNRTSTAFEIATSGGLSPGSISFDYIVID
jgi:cytoskeletal protein CcmA (bactofilin family)